MLKEGLEAETNWRTINWDFMPTNLVSCNTPPRLWCSPEVADSVDLQRKDILADLLGNLDQNSIHNTDATQLIQ